jgi:hypothetical protein
VSKNIERFFQPADAVVFLHKAPEPRTLLTDDELTDMRRRVEEGEDPEDVAVDMAAQKTAELFGEDL